MVAQKDAPPFNSNVGHKIGELTTDLRVLCVGAGIGPELFYLAEAFPKLSRVGSIVPPCSFKADDKKQRDLGWVLCAKMTTMDNENLQIYHKHIVDTYDERSFNHDNSEWHRKTAIKLVEEMPPRVGSSVLDIGTDTGFIAFYAASLVGVNGKVHGVDISEGMLNRAKVKLAETGLENVEFMLGDMEHLNLSVNSIDYLYCASAFFCVLNPLATLKHWYSILTSNGSLAFHALPETMNQCQNEYLARLQELNTDKGVWNDVTMYYVYAFK